MALWGRWILICLLSFVATYGWAADYAFSSTAVSQTGYTDPVFKGTPDVIMIRLQLTVYKATNGGGCVPAVIQSIQFSALGNPGTSSIQDISNVKIWYTGTNSSFLNPVQRGLITNPGINYGFSLNDSFCTATTAYYWLTYSVSTVALPGNLLDAQVVTSGLSIRQYGLSSSITPSSNNPFGSRAVICASVSAPPTPVLPPLEMFTMPSLGTHMANTGVSMALRTDGTVWGAGSDQNGEMGDGLVGNPNMTGNSWVWVADTNIRNIKQIGVGWSTTLALRQDGKVWSWGDNWYGKGGVGVTISPITPPRPVVKTNGEPLTNVVKVLSSYYISAALTSDRKVYAWGRNSGGAFGAPYTANSDYNAGVQLTSDGTNFINWAVDFGIGDSYISYLRWDGTVWSVGNGQYGQLGNGNLNSGSATPTAALAPGGCEILSNIVQLAVSRRFMLALSASGEVYGWGLNNYSQTGTGAGPNVIAPKRVLGPDCSGYLTDIAQIAATGDNGYAVDKNGNLYSWGSDQNGQLGNGYPPDSTVSCPKIVDQNVEEVQGSLNSILIRKSNGCVYGAGNNWYGNLGGPLPASCCGYVNTFKLTGLETACNVLPVEIVSFTGNQDGRQIKLSWTTASEVNNDFFSIKKISGNNGNSILGNYPGMGTYPSLTEYEANDPNPVIGKNYYRLSQTDFDGNENLLGTIGVDFYDAKKLDATYLQGSTEITLVITSPEDQTCWINLLESSGKSIVSTRVWLNKGRNYIPVNNYHSKMILNLPLITNNTTLSKRILISQHPE